MFGGREIVTAVEIGTSKICVLLGSGDGRGNVSILGHGEHSSDGAVVKGEITNMEKVTSIIELAIKDAERAADTEIDQSNLFLAVTGPHIKGYGGTGTANITDPDRRIQKDDIDEVVENASHISIPPEYQVLNSIHGNFLLDGIRRTSNPENQAADKLEVFSYIICGNRNSVENFCIPLRELGYDKPIPVFGAIASANGALTEEEMKHGILIIDVGAGKTEYILFHDSCALSCGVLPVGTEHLANDISLGLDLNISFARKIITEQIHTYNKEHGMPFIPIDSAIGSRKVPVSSVEVIMELRIKEIFGFIRRMLEEQDKVLHFINRGVVLCGGGAMLPETISMAKSVFQCPARTGMPPQMFGTVTAINSPRYTMITSLLSLGEKMRSSLDEDRRSTIAIIDRKLQAVVKKIKDNFKSSFKY